jgi:hypothetical protein
MTRPSPYEVPCASYDYVAAIGGCGEEAATARSRTSATANHGDDAVHEWLERREFPGGSGPPTRTTPEEGAASIRRAPSRTISSISDPPTAAASSASLAVPAGIDCSTRNSDAARSCPLQPTARWRALQDVTHQPIRTGDIAKAALVLPMSSTTTSPTSLRNL